MLKGKWCLVTGAGRGIGRSIALALAREGGSLALAARSRDQLESVAEECRAAGAGQVEVHTADLSDGKAVDALAEGLVARHGGVAVLVNNAGIAGPGMSPLAGDPDEWEKLLMLNLMAAMRLTRRLAPGMVERNEGTIINISSILGLENDQYSGVYSASKFGLRGWSLSCHETLRRSNVKVVLINPGWTDTPLVWKIPGAVRADMITPEDVAEACLLALKTSSKCVPTEITLRNALNCVSALHDPTELLMERMASQ
ncbi:unnamed protein product [Ostreobium quekettii]|uniref:Uncharacterized protein n=1 Tax=Ostreobium quekettii TaxID=121088 RepID=A0A8S1J468_9CHLO|nr:unnamed protein product [Ostreobium quekettii]